MFANLRHTPASPSAAASSPANVGTSAQAASAHSSQVLTSPLSPKEKKALQRAAGSVHPLALALYKGRVQLSSSENSEWRQLNYEAMKALDAYKKSKGNAEREAFLEAFEQVNRKKPPGDMPSADPKWGPTDNPNYRKFEKETDDLQAAYDILKRGSPES